MTKTDWTAETTDRLRTIVEFVNGRCTNEEAGRKCLGFIMQYGESWLERIAADESAVPVAWVRPSAEGYDSSFRDAITVMACPEGSWAKDGWIPLYTHPPAQPAQEQPGWKVPDALTLFPDASEHGIGYVKGWNECRAEMLAASPPTPKEN